MRRRIAWEAARLMYDRQESEYYQAKMKAARRLCRGWAKPNDLPSNAEIRDQVQLFARLYEGDKRSESLQQMRLAALRMMRLLSRFKPRLIGSVLTGHIRQGSDIDLHVFSDSLDSVARTLEAAGYAYEVERKQIRKDGQEHVYRHIHLLGEYPFELTVYSSAEARHTFKSTITGRAIEKASVAQLEQFLNTEYPELDLEQALADADEEVDRFGAYEALLLPLEYANQNPEFHPEGDALYHSLQVFDRACGALAYDEEFLTAALLHDVGKGIDPTDHVAAGLEALEGIITERTAWLIEHHMTAHTVADGTIGWRKLRRLKACESYGELVLLGECDRAGRQPGIEASDLDQAIAYLRDLSRMCNG